MKYDENWTKDPMHKTEEVGAIKHTLSDEAWQKLYIGLAMHAILNEPYGMAAIWKKAEQEGKDPEDIVANDAKIIAKTLSKIFTKEEKS